ncbi:2-keto-4-pentenoate hydratase/2-oxohepta-3-ene-1,7-dioic acid hydratase (catechol pathway) [Paenibacillus sophorae]|uniref:2-keto-4-pentenoate hydratase/2-oxohepta-3-ene-1,7-dioic acid hydratase (Catechol pathway) n=1 Tax=Paenibacillus sophorae TaxID=1333845 RepID=A0A1H8SRJ1_9BACL|nr:fumarylacetoacetate hydrolase family protein [Paenibacillus sophorae]QWU15544.1 fumarylacetoacetate hydrolase family protein [Paenibacillus sophorae]SEO81579.1 2-keto-4-pentenoate hydratase/2-oxohepta-3-ene-1,7-dioic acid hydratase (catechol pathway) [Paenibacillus sophorae]
MKLLQFIKDGQARLGVKTAEGIMDVELTARRSGLELPFSMEEVIRNSAAFIPRLQALLGGDPQWLKEEEIQYAPCVTSPQKIICVGLNYRSHAAESGLETPLVPVLFSKFNNSLAAHREKITLPDGPSQIDYEAELVLVIGKRTSGVSKEEALSSIFGYTVGNDLSARDLQFRTSQWLVGKSLDGFAPVGPCVVTADEVDPGSLNIECRVNGELRQSANTRDMIFGCAELVSYISAYITLEPGDLIFTGTPEGVILGYPEEERIWLRSGDEVTVTIEGLGTLENRLG